MTSSVLAVVHIPSSLGCLKGIWPELLPCTTEGPTCLSRHVQALEQDNR